MCFPVTRPLAMLPAPIGQRLDLAAAQPPDLETRRQLGAERLADRAAVELALTCIALAARVRVVRLRVDAVALVVDHDETAVVAAVEQVDAAGREAERTLAWAEQHRQLARDHALRDLQEPRRDRTARERVPARERVGGGAIALVARRGRGELRGERLRAVAPR